VEFDMAIRFVCDRCGVSLGTNDSKRFIVKMEAYAAAGPVEFSANDPSGDAAGSLESVLRELEQADPDTIEDQTYRCLRFDLCGPCHHDFLRLPLGRHL